MLIKLHNRIITSPVCFKLFLLSQLLNIHLEFRIDIVVLAHSNYWFYVHSTGMIATRWRGRVGSSFASSGGTIHLPSTIMNHPQYNPSYEDNDFSILRVSTFIQYLSNTVAPANIASSNYNIDDNQIVWAIGWGFTWVNVIKILIIFFSILYFYFLIDVKVGGCYLFHCFFLYLFTCVLIC